MFKHNSLWCCIETHSSWLWTVWTSYSCVWTSASGRKVYAMGAEMGELITKPEQIILVIWAMPHRSWSSISGSVIGVVFWSSPWRLWQYWDFCPVLVEQWCCEIHNSANVGGMSHGRWDVVPSAPSAKCQNLNSDISSLRSQHQDINTESLSVLVWV